jgi:hypothetical protein
MLRLFAQNLGNVPAGPMACVPVHCTAAEQANEHGAVAIDLAGEDQGLAFEFIPRQCIMAGGGMVIPTDQYEMVFQ